MRENFPEFPLDACGEWEFTDPTVNAMWVMYQILKSQPIPLPPMNGDEVIVFGGYLDTDDQSHGMKTDEGGMTVTSSRSGKFIIDESAFIVRPTHWRPLPIPPLTTEGGV